MRTCESCKGTGKMTIQAQEWTSDGFKALPEVKINCIWCSGKGQQNDHEAAVYDSADDFWCACGNPSGEVSFYREGHSHGYKCIDCGKVVQVG